MTGPATGLPKRLIEVDLPIKRISAHARREKSIRHGHISTLHIWWARRPLAACRAVILAALWPDPADPNCPQRFRAEAAARMRAFRDKRGGKPRKLDEPLELRTALLDFIADFANWDNSTDPDYLETSRALVQVAHESLGGAAGTRPLVVDPFAGGGAIPLEALRVGADAFASDLNPVAVLLNKVMLEYVPKFGVRLVDEVRKWGEWIRKEAERELADFYPKDPDGSTAIAYLWARTVRCEGPGCGAELPLLRAPWLARGPKQNIALGIVADRQTKAVTFQLLSGNPGSTAGTVRNGSATCPVCGTAMQRDQLRAQLRERKGGTGDARLIAVATVGGNGRGYRLPTTADRSADRRARLELERRIKESGEDQLLPVQIIPQERVWKNNPIRVHLYGMTRWLDLFTPRQALSLLTLTDLLHRARQEMLRTLPPDLVRAVEACLALAIDKQADSNSSLCAWRATSQDIGHTFGRQALSMVWDFAEANVLSGATRDWSNAMEGGLKALGSLDPAIRPGQVARASATRHPLPDDTASAIVTDPPYYDAVPYAVLSDYFYVWLKRSIGHAYPDLFDGELTDKREECVFNPVAPAPDGGVKDAGFFVRTMTEALTEARRVVRPDGVGVVVFAHKSTAGWEAQLQAMIDAGWIVTASWPIDTELGNRLRAMNSAALASSVHLVCRPRESQDGSQATATIGDWRDILAELPKRIHEWMPRLADEGVVGADAIFACLGPALEIFSRYSRVEKASGDEVKLKEYLEHVWAAVAKEALGMIFAGAETSEFEEDARLTAMWLWTLSTGGDGPATAEEADESSSDDDKEDGGTAKAKPKGFVLEYDAARKIAQGLGAHLEDLASLIEVKGETARLLPVAERTRALFGKAEGQAPTARRKKKDRQMRLGFAAELEEAEETGGWGEKGAPERGNTVLDRVHQSMILFAASRGEALRRFLVEDSVGSDQRFWRLAQAFAALYPAGTDERRWVEGVLARKKGLGL